MTAHDLLPRLHPWIGANLAIRTIIDMRWTNDEWEHAKNILRELLRVRIEMEHGAWWN